ncbi:putative heme d1 biosynthesis radical SAM protein NirJ1 [Tindallia magadiensis]|uniref:Mycofactocin maturase MftC n=1 Tax=Tindallia magadiensis TaxID=69895 RepID=A0A1I3DUZ3_9FIRM|nr:putative heme d1 biosynthesis radical SAM protein NirJ1 [Tindallia magadiensis]SFH90550.1 putative heme d1 biosynthesis radical SAM protein NirJ1 [Tindallia magadiensis]
MISFTKFLTGAHHYGDQLRYQEESAKWPHGIRKGCGPVVAWNTTRTCNLRCIHCYMNSDHHHYPGELTHEEAMIFIRSLADFRVPVLLFSGGEPLIRPDFFELAEEASRLGIRPTLSTNGTLITKKIAQRLKSIGIGYVGISLDGLEKVHDQFRQKQGSFQQAFKGIENCVAEGQRVGLRFTINRQNMHDVDEVLDLVEEAKIDRICFYHLVYSGRGSELTKDVLTPEETRQVVDRIIDRTLDFQRRGLNKEILSVDNHADGVYLYLKLRESHPEKAANVLSLLKRNGGNRSGMAFANVDSQGNVHPDQFTQNHCFGNVKEKPFSQIWQGTKHPIQAGLKNRKPLLKGRCATCHWLDLCNGNFRARAEAVTGDFWESDPACYLTDKEISKEGDLS